MKRTALKRKTPLKAHKRLNPVSPKQAAINELWREITDERASEENFTCQWCHGPGQRTDPQNIFTYLDGHHKTKRRYNIHTKENCYIAHRLCHGFIEEYGIDVRVYPDKRAWKEASND